MYYIKRARGLVALLLTENRVAVNKVSIPHAFSDAIYLPQYAATVDETPAYLGGKDNTWRKLNLDGM